MWCEKTIYNYIDSSLLDVRNIELPPKVRYSARSKEKVFKLTVAAVLAGLIRITRSFCQKNLEYSMWKWIPSLEVSVKKFFSLSTLCHVLLWLHWSGMPILPDRSLTILMTFITSLAEKTVKSSSGHLDRQWKWVFKSQRNRVWARTEWCAPYMGFYCDAGKLYQKGAIEIDHELSRRVLPYGEWSFSFFLL